jgi:hypothetical protein
MESGPRDPISGFNCGDSGRAAATAAKFRNLEVTVA